MKKLFAFNISFTKTASKIESGSSVSDKKVNWTNTASFHYENIHANLKNFKYNGN